jgi:hypothetical protein
MSVARAASAADPYFLARDSSLRRRLLSELAVIGRLITHSKLDDSLTKEISHWQKKFFLDLRTSGNEQVVRDRHFESLQTFLCDPIFDPDKSRLWALIDHPIAQHMVKWLKNSFEDGPKAHLPRRLDEVLEQLRQERREQQDVPLPEVNDEKKDEEEVQENIVSVGDLREQLRARLQLRANIDPLKEVKQRAEALQAAQEASMEQMQREVDEYARERFAPFAMRGQVFAERAGEVGQHLDQLRLELQRRFDQLIQDMEVNIQNLERRNQEYRERLEGLKGPLSETERKIVVLEQKLCEAEIVAREMKKDSMKELVQLGVGVAIAFCSNYVLKFVLEGSTFGIGIQPLQGGGQINITKPI